MPRNSTSSQFMIKQRAFLKVYLICLAEEDRLYGLEFLDEIKKEFSEFGYIPNHSEIYKSLHELIKQNILLRHKTLKEGMVYQEIIYYSVGDKKKANLYKREVYEDLQRSTEILNKCMKRIKY